MPALFTIAFGIGLTTAVFSFAHAILLRPFPYGEPERLVRVFTVLSNERDAERNCSLLDIDDYNRRSTLLENFGAYTVFDSQIEGDGPAQTVSVAQLSQEALRALAVPPALGRLFTAEEDRKGGPVNKAIISHSLWLSRYGGDRTIIGRTIRTPMASFEVVGVMPAGFGFPERSDLWLTMESWYALGLGNGEKQRDERWYATVAKLKPGVTLAQAEAEMDQIAKSLEAEYPRENGGVRIKLRSLRDATVGSIEPYVLLLSSGAGLALVISIFNVANLLLARVLARQKQYAIQTALGASRWEVSRGLLAESLVLAIAGGVLGAGFAAVAVEGLRQLLPESIPHWMRIEVDLAVLGFCFVVALTVGLTMGLAPALLGSRLNLERALKKGAGRSSAVMTLRSTLVIVEVAIALLLMVGAGLLTKTFTLLQQTNHGFQAENLIVARVSNSRFGTGNREERAGLLSRYHEEMQERLGRIPGITQVAVTNALPYSGVQTRQGRLRILGIDDQELQFLLPVAGADVNLDFFQTMEIPLLAGRYFERTDSPEAPPVVILNETAAKALFGDQNPIGRMIQWGDTVGPSNPYCRVVGVVGDVKWEAGEPDTIGLYYPFTQWPVGTAYYLLRTESRFAELGPQVRKVVQASDLNAAVAWIKPMTERIDEALWQRRLWGALFSAFGALAILLAAVGLYGTLAYTVSQRTREICIRLAIGAGPAAVRTAVITHGMKLVLIGIAIGAGLSVAAIRALASLVDGSAIQDWSIYAAVAAVLGLTGLAASAAPAFRASRMDPLRALREE
jgi:putative ABC transport system permease protein